MREGLPELLDDFIASNMDRPFEWGRHDCCLFAADWVLELTGIDHAKAFRGQYSTGFGASKKLLPFGGVVGVFDASEAITHIRTGYAGRGDLVAAKIGERGEIGVGVCLGSRSAFVGMDGIYFMQTHKITNAWRIN
jgi:hypothetical protein